MLRLKVIRTVNGAPVGDGDIKNHPIVNRHVIQTLYNALRRAR